MGGREAPPAPTDVPDPAVRFPGLIVSAYRRLPRPSAPMGAAGAARVPHPYPS